MSIFTKALNFIGEVTGVGTVKQAVGAIVTAIKGDPELEKQLQEFELEQLRLEMAENASVRELLKAEVASEDKFVRRVRPAVIWCVVIIIATNFVVLPVLNAILSACGVTTVALDYPDLPENVYWLFGSLFGLYTGARSWDKRGKGRNGK